jgi:hypothetical protein
VSSTQRESSGEMTEKYGFSVVAASSVTVAVLDRGEQRVLLGLAEPVHLVDEQDGGQGRRLDVRDGRRR